MRRGALGSQHADSPHLQDLLLQRRAPAPKRLVLLLHRPNLCRPHTRVGAGVLPCWGLPPHSADIAVLGGRCAVGAPVGRLPTQAGRESSVRGRAPRQRGHRPKTAGGCRELLGPARPGAQACLRGDQPDATQGITRAARGLGGCYPLGSSERMPRSSRTGSARDTGWKRRTFSCLGAWLGVAERTPAILPARREQGQRTELPPQLPEVPQSSLQAPPPGLQPAGGGCSPGTSPPLPSPPHRTPRPHRSVQVLLAVLQHVHNGAHGQQRSPGSEVTWSWAEQLQGDRDRLGRKLPWHPSLPRRLPRWHGAARGGPSGPRTPYAFRSTARESRALRCFFTPQRGRTTYGNARGSCEVQVQQLGLQGAS